MASLMLTYETICSRARSLCGAMKQAVVRNMEPAIIINPRTDLPAPGRRTVGGRVGIAGLMPAMEAALQIPAMESGLRMAAMGMYIKSREALSTQGKTIPMAINMEAAGMAQAAMVMYWTKG